MPIALKSIQKAKLFSDEKIHAIREELNRRLAGRELAVVALGSLARREANEHSDLDYVVLSNKVGRDSAELLSMIDAVATSVNLAPPSAGGAFGRVVSTSELLTVIGGEGDLNSLFTRRILFLLESEWLFDEELHLNVLQQVVRRYIADSISEGQLARYFLNDVIRYYRTICVDFEHKTGSIGKSWGDRNIKLLFSRKLLYFSGVVAAAATARSTALEKRQTLAALLRKTPIERIESVCGDDSSQVLAEYDGFLGWLTDSSSRSLLRATTADRSSHQQHFRMMKNAGHRFSWSLERLLKRSFPGTHPIHQALVL